MAQSLYVADARRRGGETREAHIAAGLRGRGAGARWCSRSLPAATAATAAPASRTPARDHGTAAGPAGLPTTSTPAGSPEAITATARSPGSTSVRSAGRGCAC